MCVFVYVRACMFVKKTILKNMYNIIRKSVIGSNIHIEVNTFLLVLKCILKLFTTFRIPI